jgi:phytoene desaturase
MKMQEPENAVVIGAGLGGLASAALLASKGYAVSVYEKNATAGGKMQEVRSGEYRFDTGPSLFTMPFVLESLFNECGEKMQEYLTWSELNPICRYFYSDGVIFDNFSDRELTKEQITRFAPDDADSYDGFLNRSEELYNKTADAFLFNPLYSFSDLKNLKLTDFLGIDAFSTVSDKVDEHFSSDHLRKFFKRFTTYNGSSPYLAPATLNVIPHVELNQGGYYVQGGLYRIAEAFQQLGEKKGVKFHFNKTVKSIGCNGDRAQFVILDDGSEMRCDLLIANSDATDTILNLLPGSVVSNRKKRRQEAIEPSCSGFVMLLGCNRTWDQLRHHNIFFSTDYQKEFQYIFDSKVMPEDPTIYVANTSFTDPDHAPPGGSNLFILVNAPYVTAGQDWETAEKEYSQFLINDLEKRGLEGLGNSIEYSETITPADFLKRYGSNRGSIYGTSSNSRFAAFLRPRNKFRGLNNLYLVGGSTHPGGGIPLVVQSAFNAVELLEREGSPRKR